MAQKEEQILPLFLQTDNAVERLQPNESPFIKGAGFDQTANPSEEAGAQNGTGEGYNALIQSPTRSNQVLSSLPSNSLPSGYNKCCGTFESIETNEFYYGNFNENGNHGIYVVDCNTGVWNAVIVDSNLPFTDGQDGYLSEHRWSMRLLYDANKNIIAKFLVFTNAAGWQGWINVVTAIATDGFNASLYPYFTLLQPHFDRRELLEWAPRPCMYNPLSVAIPNTTTDIGKVNRVVDQAWEFSEVINYTDGRQTTNSPYSLPVIIKSEDFSNNPDTLSKNILITLYAGSCMVESIDLYVRSTYKNIGGAASNVSWGDWYKYKRIYKYSNSETSSADVLSTPYWLRTGAWSGLNYDPIQNTIQYVFDNSLQYNIVDQNNANRLQNDIPIQSVSLTDIGDAALLGDNLYGYDNLSGALISNLSVQVQNQIANTCPVPLREISLYAYIGRPTDNNLYYSQVGYYNGQDTTIRFGSLAPGPSTTATFSEEQSKQFGLDFADKKAFRCYLKGTPFYTDGIWYQINSDFSQVEITEPLDFSNTDTLSYVQNVYTSGGFFVCKFTLKVPAGRYIATIGRHNIPSSGDYRNTSTYIMGIANSRAGGPQGNTYTIIPQKALISLSKEMEIDCTAGNIDVWGTGINGDNGDIFYIFCPYQPVQGNNSFRFIEGYLQESPSSPLGVELFPYQLNIGTNASGQYTDKNGFYFAFIKQSNADTANIEVNCTLNCSYPFHFEIPTNQGGIGWKVNGTAYVSDHNNGVFGSCNRVIYNGKTTSIDGTIGYSNVAISIKDGATVYTQSDGTFTLVIHNGLPTPRVSNVYVNAGGNFLITISDCGNVAIYHYSETLVPCTNCNVRIYPVPLILGVNVQGGTQYSLKENGSYSIGGVGADLAGRMGFVNIIVGLTVPSFLQTGVVQPTFFQLLINGALNLPSWMAWFAPCVSDLLGIIGYLDWIADSLAFIDSNGNVVSDQSSATFISLTITSLYNNNLGKNFTLLSNYQFTQGDRLRLMDDGNGNLLDVATYGEPIDVQILGTNYNQAAMTAGIIPNSSPTPIINNNIANNVTTNVTAASGSATVTTLQTTENATAITLYVKYDPRFVPFINNTGLWIELYTPEQVVQEVDFNELQWYPVNNGEIAIFEGFNNGQPSWDYPTKIDIPFWDTYLFSRSINIPGVGNQFFPHPFQSQNISDSFGYHVNSGGRQDVNNDDAKQEWFPADVIKSDDFSGSGIVNGLGTFRGSGAVNNRHDFSQYPFGPINMMRSQRSIIFVLCQYDWFTVTFDFHFTYPNAQGVMVVNLDNNISTPSQKIGSNYGVDPEDTGTVVVYEELISWYDRKNQAWVISDYRTAKDISLFNQNEGVIGGMSSYLNSKTRAICAWNKTAPTSSQFDVIGGVDLERGNFYLTFRPRRNNSNDPSSYGTHRRNIDLNHQETLVYSTITRRFTRFENFTPEAYGKMRGGSTGIQMVTFAAGVPYIHNTGNTSFNSFYGVQYDPVIIGVFNQNQSINKIFANVVLDINGPGMFIDFLRTNEPNSFSYVPINLVNKQENKYYLTLLRDFNSYFPPGIQDAFRSTLIDGKRIYNLYLLFRLIGDPAHRGEYFELKTIYSLFTDSTNEKK